MEGLKRHFGNMNSAGDDRPLLISLLPLQELPLNERQVESTSYGSENGLDSPVIMSDDSAVDALDESSSGDTVVTPERATLLKSGRCQKHSPLRSYSQSSGTKIVFSFLNNQKKVPTRTNNTPRSISEMNLFEQQQSIQINNSRPVATPIISVDSPYSNNKENMPICKEDNSIGLGLSTKMSNLNIGVPKLTLGRNVNPLSLSTDCILGRLDDPLFNSPPSRFSDKGRLQAEAENIRRNTRISPRKSKLETLTKTSQPELNCLCSETVAKLVLGEYKDLYERIIIIDCRFEYEYLGGHIKGAINFPKEEDVDKYFIKDNDYHKFGEKLCLVFHCEFSSHRGPKSYKRIRSNDRKINESFYPDLYYPEMYLLEGGYKQFFKDFPELCEPRGYVEMKDPLYVPEMRLGMQSRGRSKSQRRFFSQSCSSITLELDKSKPQDGDKEPVVPMSKNHTARQ
jgi:rhodanese-related sulfurtransferase